MVSLKAFQVFFVHLVYNSALFLASCCCSFWLHVAVNFICVALSSLRLILLSPLPKCPHSFCGQTAWVSRCSSEKFHLDLCQSLFILLSGVPNYVERSFSPAVSITVYRNVSPSIHNYCLLGKGLMINIICKQWKVTATVSKSFYVMTFYVTKIEVWRQKL